MPLKAPAIDLVQLQKSWFFLGSMPFMVCAVVILLMNHVEKGIRLEQDKIVNIIKPNYTVLRVRPDSRRQTSYRASPEAINRIVNHAPGSISLAQHKAETRFHLHDANKNILQRETRLIFHSPGLFNALNGSLSQGRLPSFYEAESHKAVALIGQSLAQSLLGDTKLSLPFRADINGRHFDIVGVWDFGLEGIAENHSLFLPMSAVQLVADGERSYLNTFIVEGTTRRALDSIKAAIDASQLENMMPFNRPEFQVIQPEASFKYDVILQQGINPTKFIMWFVMFIVLGIGLQKWHLTLKKNPKTLAIRRLAMNKKREIVFSLSLPMIKVVTMAIIGAYGLSILIIFTIGSFNNIPFAPSSPIVMQLLFLFIFKIMGILVISTLHVQKTIPLRRWLGQYREISSNG